MLDRSLRLVDLGKGFYLLSHPGPFLFLMTAVTACVAFSSDSSTRWSTIFLAVAAHGFMQLSIHAMNDYCDRELDAASKPAKPILRGLVTPLMALTLGVASALLILAMLLFLPFPALLILLVYFALMQSYNFGLKSTPWSGLILGVGLPLLPVYALLAVGNDAPIVRWLLPVGIFVGLVANLSDSLPDLEGDQAHGARTLVVALGAARSFALCTIALVASCLLTIVLAATNAVPASPVVLAVMVATVIAIVVAMTLVSGPDRPIQTRKVYFRLAATACVVIPIGWVVATVAV